VKIVFLITQSELGGAQRWLFDVAANLDRKKYQIMVAAGLGGPLLEKLECKEVRLHYIENLTRGINPIKDLLAFFEIYRLIKKERPDILQLCSSKAGFIGALAGKLAGVKKIIYRIGGWAFNDPRPVWQNKIILWLEKLSAPFKDKIIVNSQHDFDQALRLKIYPKEKLFLLYNGINPKIYDSEFKIQEDKKITLAAIANDYPAKGLKYFYEAIAILNPKPYTLNPIIIGKGSLIGPKANPWQYLAQQGVDIFVIPSVKEGVPYVLLEAMAAGLAIVATTVGGIPEIIKDQKNGLLVPPKNPLALAEAMEKLIRQPADKNLRQRLGEQAKKDVGQFSLEKMLAQYQSILQA